MRHSLVIFNPLNAELNPICHLLALLGAQHILHVSGIRVKILFCCYFRMCVKSRLAPKVARDVLEIVTVMKLA